MVKTKGGIHTGVINTKTHTGQNGVHLGLDVVCSITQTSDRSFVTKPKNSDVIDQVADQVIQNSTALPFKFQSLLDPSALENFLPRLGTVRGIGYCKWGKADILTVRSIDFG